MLLEQFAKIKEYPNYAISNYGQVLNIMTQKYLKPCINTSGYLYVKLFANNTKRKNHSIHRLISIYFIDNPRNYLVVDHINGNRLDNRIENLRWVSHQINSRNSRKNPNSYSLFKGVIYLKKYNRWRSRIMVNRKNYHLGYYATELEAGKAYNNYIINNNLEGFILNDVTEQLSLPEFSQLNVEQEQASPLVN